MAVGVKVDVTLTMAEELWLDFRKMCGGAAEAKRAIKQFIRESVDRDSDRADREDVNAAIRAKQEARATRYVEA